MAYLSRRHMLQGAAALGFGGSTGLLGGLARTAHAQNGPSDASGYKALVCVFLKGGLDAADAVLPLDAESHDALREVRQDVWNQYGVGSGESSRDRENLLELSTARDWGGRRFALPPEMAPLHSLYTQGRMAVLGNVGPLVEPTTRTTMDNGTATVPRRLFSHNDQQSTWMSGGLEGRRAGWGGDFAARTAPASGMGRTFAAVTAGAAESWLRGPGIQQYPARRSGAVRLRFAEERFRLGGDADAARQVLRDHYASRGASSANLLRRDLAVANRRTQEDNATFTQAIQNAPDVLSVFPDTGLGRQLATIADTIAVRGQLGASRQLFYAERGGFDTHDNQVGNLPRNLGDVAESIAAFAAAMEEMGLSDRVTLFTMSDFGRTVVVNGAGTDHGWGGHHFVVGGAVRGGEIFGDLPPVDLGLQTYTRSRGRLIPSTSVDQYAASLGRWFGLEGDALRDALPNLGNFDDVPDLFGLGGTV